MEQSAKVPSQTIENPQSIGEHLRKRRQELKMTQKSVAEKIGVSEDCITYWENGRSVPQVQYYPKIIGFLGYIPFPVDNKTIGGQIQLYRFENGLSRKRLAKIMGFDPVKLTHWEQNIAIPNSECKMKLVIMDVLK